MGYLTSYATYSCINPFHMTAYLWDNSNCHKFRNGHNISYCQTIPWLFKITQLLLWAKSKIPTVSNIKVSWKLTTMEKTTGFLWGMTLHNKTVLSRLLLLFPKKAAVKRNTQDGKMRRNPVSTAELFLWGHGTAQVGYGPGQGHPNPFSATPCKVLPREGATWHPRVCPWFPRRPC